MCWNVRVNQGRRALLLRPTMRMLRAVEAAGGEVCMTRADHQSGTERLAEVVEKCGFSDDTVIVNVQGDEPMIPPAIIRQVEKTWPLATLAWLRWRCRFIMPMKHLIRTR